jgi:hypothetical protein
MNCAWQRLRLPDDEPIPFSLTMTGSGGGAVQDQD